MSRLEKLVERFLREPPEVRFSDVIRLLEAFGYRLHSTKGSHSAFTKRGASTIIVPVRKGRRVKKRYVHNINDLLELEEWYEQETGKERP